MMLFTKIAISRGIHDAKIIKLLKNTEKCLNIQEKMLKNPWKMSTVFGFSREEINLYY